MQLVVQQFEKYKILGAKITLQNKDYFSLKVTETIFLFR